VPQWRMSKSLFSHDLLPCPEADVGEHNEHRHAGELRPEGRSQGSAEPNLLKNTSVYVRIVTHVWIYCGIFRQLTGLPLGPFGAGRIHSLFASLGLLPHRRILD
jgi:hypothetical protein